MGTENVPRMTGKLRVLVGEDDFSTSRAWCELIASWGYVVEVAADGGRVLELVDGFAPDAILLDLGLPGKDGLQVLAELRAKGFKVPTVVISGRSAKNDAEQSISLGAREYLRKPVDTTKLQSLLSKLAEPDADGCAGPSPRQLQLQP